MTIDKKKNIFEGVDVDSIIRKSLNAGLKKETDKLETTVNTLSESYVAEPKQFQQVSEFVSQKTKNAHMEKYKDYLEALNKVSAELDTADRGTANSRHSAYRSLKLDETYNLNAAWLHELYFANCFDPHSEIVMNSASFIDLQKVWGTFDDWQRDFMACAMACGQGWAICGYNVYLKNYVNTIVSNHSQDVLMGLYPIVVLDLHEHAYQKDYLNDKKSYIIAMMRELNWEVIEERFKKAKNIAQAVK
jgi:Fe-Mn family superoxide dismutase